MSAERGLTPLVGRKKELDLLSKAFEKSKLGRGQVVSVVSDAGMGKSRLLYEFRKSVANEDVTFLEGKCLSYSRNLAYHPIIDILRSNFDIRNGESDSTISEKVEKGLQMLDADQPSTYPYLLDLLSVRESGIEPGKISDEARKIRIMKAI